MYLVVLLLVLLICLVNDLSIVDILHTLSVWILSKWVITLISKILALVITLIAAKLDRWMDIRL